MELLQSSSILDGDFHEINHPFRGTLIYGHPQVDINSDYMLILWWLSMEKNNMAVYGSGQWKLGSNLPSYG